MARITSTQIRLASRPEGWPAPDNFTTVAVGYDDPVPGEVRVVNHFISVDPYMRGRMNDTPSYVPPFALNETITGGAIGRVVESTSAALPVGTPVLHEHGWTDIIQADAKTFHPVPDIPGTALSAHLHILGMTGLTAYAGLTRIAELRKGDTVFISGAAGAVGTAVGQMARLLGAGRVVGSAGSAAKVDLLTGKYGFDAALNYKVAPVREQLADLVPGGVDVYFDNVGGDHLEAALDVMNNGGRVAMCGAIAGYNETEPVPGPDNLPNVITRSLSLRGFTIGSHLDLLPEFTEAMARWFEAEQITYDETVIDGIDRTVDAFLAMMNGANTGKMLVNVSNGDSE